MAPVRNCPKGARMAKLHYIRSKGHLSTTFRKNSTGLGPIPFRGRYD